MHPAAEQKIHASCLEGVQGFRGRRCSVCKVVSACGLIFRQHTSPSCKGNFLKAPCPDAEGAAGAALAASEQAGSSGLSAFEAGFLHGATAMGMRAGEGALPPTSYGGPPGSGPEGWSPE